LAAKTSWPAAAERLRKGGQKRPQKAFESAIFFNLRPSVRQRQEKDKPSRGTRAKALLSSGAIVEDLAEQTASWPNPAFSPLS
jgi:hypothetical protein